MSTDGAETIIIAVYVDDILIGGKTASTVWLGQPAYSENIILQFNMQNAKTCRTPVNPSLKLSKSTEEFTRVDQPLHPDKARHCLCCEYCCQVHI